jgi:glutathione peroxidase-family protein
MLGVSYSSVVMLWVLVVLGYCAGSVMSLANNHKDCEFWANIGECTKNPNYMLTQCSLACNSVLPDEPVQEQQELGSCYDIVEKDANGNEVKFDQFRGKVVYIVNVASYCGYTAENYQLFRALSKYRKLGLEIVIAPCNQFGFQEPGDGVAVTEFAHKQKFEGIILSKADVNGEKTRASFDFLKRATNRDAIYW